MKIKSGFEMYGETVNPMRQQDTKTLSVKPKNINQESLELSKNVKISPDPFGWNNRISLDFNQINTLPSQGANRKPKHTG